MQRQRYSYDNGNFANCITANNGLFLFCGHQFPRQSQGGKKLPRSVALVCQGSGERWRFKVASLQILGNQPATHSLPIFESCLQLRKCPKFGYTLVLSEGVFYFQRHVNKVKKNPFIIDHIYYWLAHKTSIPY